MAGRQVATYPLGPVQATGNPLWVQDSYFMPYQQNMPTSYQGMAYYGGFVEAIYDIRVPSYQPGMPTNPATGRHLAMYSGFVNEHSLKGI